MVPMPDGALLFRTGTACDMLIGPCACGATHTVEQIAREVIERHRLVNMQEDTAKRTPGAGGGR